MSLVQPDPSDNRPSTALALNLSSNNPFRNRAASPSFPPGSTSPLDLPPRPVSRNPFLDSSASNLTQQQIRSPEKMAIGSGSTSPKSDLTGNAAELFESLTFDDKPSSASQELTPTARAGPLPPSYASATGSRTENIPPRGSHRPSRSREEALRARKAAGSSKPRPSEELDIFADPAESSTSRARRVRRNSESSVMDRSGKPLDPEEEKKRQERRRRRRDGKDSKSRKPDRKLDVIDKLDVTSIYGTGLFHHDGPFDACNPHRNRQGSRRAPMQAFPKDSLNNVLGGGGPINKRPDHAIFMGNNNEAFDDYSKGGAGFNGYEPYSNGAIRPTPVGPEGNVLSATTRVEPIHGEETLGLGTSTFLEGAPASRTAMQRRESETATPTDGGLSRKKSLAQKIRAINTNRREYGPSGRVTSPEGVYGATSPEAIYTPGSANTPGGSRIHESNPFFNEFTKGDDKKESITIVEPERHGSPPRRGFERRTTSDGGVGSDQPAKSLGGGFMSRVKSLKGGSRKARNQPEDQ
ncbi:hypothetical protein B7494_g7032 [Chlorociboria aeruginascens]|nr:hypothetical protein B7494_g7032 [Chlorociboria aeruginascens]